MFLVFVIYLTDRVKYQFVELHLQVLLLYVNPPVGTKSLVHIL